jgi:hypothetical protein
MIENDRFWACFREKRVYKFGHWTSAALARYRYGIFSDLQNKVRLKRQIFTNPTDRLKTKKGGIVPQKLLKNFLTNTKYQNMLIFYVTTDNKIQGEYFYVTTGTQVLNF